MTIHTVPMENNLVVFKQGENTLYLFNASARLIWEYLAQGHEREQTCTLLAEQFDIAPEIIMRDYDQALSDWREKGLMTSEASDVKENTVSGNRADEDFALTNKAVALRRRYTIFGVTLEIGFQNADLEAMVHPLCAHLETDISKSERRPDHVISFLLHNADYIVLTDGAEAGSDPEVHQAIGILIHEIICLIHPQKNQMTVIHASAVRNDTCGIIFPALGGSGKSTLTAALIRSGFDYLGDDVVPVENQHQHAVAVPLSLCLKSGSWPVLSSYYPELKETPAYRRYYKDVKYIHPPGVWDADTQAGWPVKCLIFPQYKQNNPVSLQRIAPTEALQRLIDAGVWVSSEPDDVRLFIDWIESLPCYDLSFESLEEAISSVGEIIQV